MFGNRVGRGIELEAVVDVEQVNNIFGKKIDDIFDKYLKRDDFAVKENANTGFSLSGLKNYISEELTKKQWLNKFYSRRVSRAHQQGYIHIHDLGILGSYCNGWDLKDLLLNGLGGVEDKTVSKPAKRVASILGQIYNFIFTIQEESAGAQAFSNVDTLVAPFIRYTNMDYDTLKQEMQGFIHNLNVTTRAGFQIPFSNITLDLKCPSHLKDQNVIYGGVLQKETYKEFQKEIEMFDRAFFEVMLEGDGAGKVFSFPVLTINIDKEFDWDNPNLELLWETTKRFGLPNFTNYVSSGLNIEDVRSMCCRLSIDISKIQRGGMFSSIPLTGGIGVVTLNLARLGYLYQNEKDLFNAIKRNMDTASEALEIKRDVVEKFFDLGLYPYSSFYLRDVKLRTGSYMGNHFSIIAPLGMNELCENFLGKDISTQEGQDLALRILKFMHERTDFYTEATGHNYSLEQSPAEGASGSLKNKDKNMFPEMKHKIEDISYTNSTHLPVNHGLNILDALSHQSAFNKYYTGGSVFHVFCDQEIDNNAKIKSFIKSVVENYPIPYFSYTPTFSMCKTHGYLVGCQDKCPKCGADTLIYSKIVGYQRPISSWGNHKKVEFDNRKMYSI